MRVSESTGINLNNHLKNMKENVDSYQISLKVFLMNSKKEVLILKATDDSISAGYYDLPGGRINIDEFNSSFSIIVKREIAEELGNIQYTFCDNLVAASRNVNTKTGNRILHLFFKAEYLSGELKISEEHLGYKWIDLKAVELDKYFSLGILEGVKMYISSLD